MGQGETTFSALGPSELPELQWGLQGGQHVWMAVQVHNPDLDRRQLKIRLELKFCTAADCSDPGAWETDIIRDLVADETTMTLTPEGWLQQTRMLVTVFGWVTTENRRVEMLVTDPCGRQAFVTRDSTAS